MARLNPRHLTTGLSTKAFPISLREVPDALGDGHTPQPPPAVDDLR